MYQILIVDDSRAVLKAIGSQMEGKDYAVHTAQSVKEAWTLLERQPFDCILSDFEMPEIDGPGFCRKLKSDERYAHIPVIILTSKTEADHLLTAIDAGADDFISKSSDTRVVLAKVRAMLRIKSFRDELTRLRRVEGIKQIVATYNHEFNNPLTIAIGNLNWLRKHSSDSEQITRMDRLAEALQRMGELVKKIRELRDYVEAAYVGDDRMVDLFSPSLKKSS